MSATSTAMETKKDKKYVQVYALAKTNPKDTKEKYRVLQMDGKVLGLNGKPMLFPFRPINGENKLLQGLRRINHNMSAASGFGYSDDERKGRNPAQADASKAFEQTIYNPEGMPIKTDNGLFNGQRLTVVEIDLNNHEDIRECPLPNEQQYIFPTWLSEKIVEWTRENANKAIAQPKAESKHGNEGQGNDLKDGKDVKDVKEAKAVVAATTSAQPAPKKPVVFGAPKKPENDASNASRTSSTVSTTVAAKKPA